MNAATTQDHTGFTTTLSEVRRNIFLPKYYNPEITARLADLKKTHKLVTLGELIQRKQPLSRDGRRDRQDGVWHRHDPLRADL